jgi:hypothetical protein
MLRFLAERVRETTTALEASMHWARQVAAGNFTEARALSMLTADERVIAPDETTTTEPERAVSMDTAVQLPVALGGAFGRAAAALERPPKRRLSRARRKAGQASGRVLIRMQTRRAIAHDATRNADCTIGDQFQTERAGATADGASFQGHSVA